MAQLPPYFFHKLNTRITELRAAGREVIRMDAGSPDLPPAVHILSALERSARDPQNHGYQSYNGTPEYRAAWRDFYAERFGVHLDDRETTLVIGAKEGVFNLSQAYLDPGDVSLVPDPGYAPYSAGARFAGADVYYMQLRETDAYLPDFDAIPADVVRRAKLMWLNYPNNPTGATAERDFYQHMVDYCRVHNILLASDNPYCEVTFDGYTAGSALEADGAMDCTIEFVSLSKSHNMAGWRLGAAVGNPDAIKTLLTVKSNVDSGHFQAIYDAGIMAFDEVPQAWINERNLVYQRRRDLILDALPHIGLTAHKPKGSLYVWGRVAEGDGASYAEQALMKAHVSIAPGAIYGPGGTNYVRFSVGVADDRLEEALARLKKWYTSR